MATNDVLMVTGNCISFAKHAALSPTAANVIEHGTPTDVELDLTGVLATEARESAKFDFGQATASWAGEWSITSCFEVASGAAADGEVVELWMGYSQSATAGTGNPGGLSGTDADYTGTGQSALTPSLKQLTFIGAHVCTLDDTLNTPQVQIASCGTFQPKARYGCLVVVNKMTGAFHTDVIETNIVFSPIIPQVQAAV